MSFGGHIYCREFSAVSPLLRFYMVLHILYTIYSLHGSDDLKVTRDYDNMSNSNYLTYYDIRENIFKVRGNKFYGFKSEY